MNAAQLLVKQLEAEGVRYVFGVPGEENLDFLEALRESSIRLIVTRHEQGAGFMAATHGRLTGKAGVCLSTLGPGATNLVTPAAFAQLGAMPMLMITGQKPIKKSKQGRFQIIDVVDMMRPLTKLSRQVVSGEGIPALVREALRTAEEERPGAVLLELPEDIAREEVRGEAIPPHVAEHPVATREAVAAAARMIEGAKRPLVLIGASANRKTVGAAMEQLLEKTGMYFFTTQMGKGVVDEVHPHFLGTAALSANDYLHCAIDRADLIVNVGHDVIEKPPFFMEAGGKQVIHVNAFPAQVDPIYFPQHEVVGDIAQSLLMLAEQITPAKAWDFAYYGRIKKEVEEHLEDKSDSEAFPMLPQRVVADVRAALPKDAIVSLDNGMYKIWFARNFRAHLPNTLLLDNALATMGAGLPGAMAAKLLYPKRTVVAVCGDGGFLMNEQELETALRMELDLVIVILRDDGYGMIKWKQEDMGFKNFGLEFKNPDFVKLAESYGAKGHRVAKTAEFLPLLTECAQAGGIHVIDLPVDYSENHRVLSVELKEKTCIL